MVKPVIDEALLSAFRIAGACALCGVLCRRRVPHHVVSRGFGGATRFDLAVNLLSLGGPFDCSCHRDCDEHRIPFRAQVDAVAAREGREPADVEDELLRLRWGKSVG